MSININSENLNYKDYNQKPLKKKYYCPCTAKQLVCLILPFTIIGLYLAIFLPIFLTSQREEKYKIVKIGSNNTVSNNDIKFEEYNEFEEYVANYSYATLTPINGYHNIYIHLGNIYETADTYFDFFKSKETFIPKNTKLYFLNGKKRIIKYTEKNNYLQPVSSWFNVDVNGELICNNCEDEYDEAKESLNIILDFIDKIKNEEKIEYEKIFLGGYGQGAAMVNYVLLNSKHKLGGYCIFSGYFFDNHFPSNNSVVTNLTAEQKEILESKKDYKILSTFSFKDNFLSYSEVSKLYYNYYKEYINFLFYSFNNFGFTNMPIMPTIKAWLKNEMEK